MNDIDTHHNIDELLRWYSEAGVDVALSDEPVDRFLETAEQTQKRKAVVRPSSDTQNVAPEAPSARQASQSIAPATAPPATPTIPNDGAVAMAQEVANNASTVEEMKASLGAFEACNLKFTARTTVFSDGNASADVMFVGGAPDRDEDEQGLPFVGNRGQLFDKMIDAIGLERARVYLSCALPWRPPGNRAPSPAEMDICRPLINKHIELASPKVIVLMGSLPSKMLLNSKGSVMSMRGKWSELKIGDATIPALSMLNPAYLLQNPEHKRLAWNDLLVLKEHLGTLK
jgi:DNA polymerase